jgi:septum formation protein
MPSLVTNAPLILASQSPRRRYLLQKAGLRFTVRPSEVDESGFTLEDPAGGVQRLAEAKALQVAEAHPDHWVIGADTVVVVEGRVLGKPTSVADARDMLRRLSGATRQVYTGFCIVCKAGGARFGGTVCTDVTFKNLTETEIEWYVHSGEPFDKAGAYAIQGLGTFLVRRIHGSYTNVVGLPVCEVLEILIREGIMGLEPPAPDPQIERQP